MGNADRAVSAVVNRQVNRPDSQPAVSPDKVGRAVNAADNQQDNLPGSQPAVSPGRAVSAVVNRRDNQLVSRVKAGNKVNGVVSRQAFRLGNQVKAVSAVVSRQACQPVSPDKAGNKVKVVNAAACRQDDQPGNRSYSRGNVINAAVSPDNRSCSQDKAVNPVRAVSEVASRLAGNPD